MAKKEEQKQLTVTVKDLERRFGAGIVTVPGKTKPPKVEVISTGILSLDYAIRRPDPEHGIGLGGIPRGRMTEIWGPESSGKSSLLMQIIAQVQRVLQKSAGYIDLENSLDPHYARKLGVIYEDLVISQPDYGEQALEVTQSLIESNCFGMVVEDSVGMLTPQAEIEGEMGDAHPGLTARLVTQGIRKLNKSVKETKCALVFINQIREKIGVYYGSSETTPGGRALRHMASLRLSVRKKETLKLKEQVVGYRAIFRVVKNKLDSPYQETEVDFLYGRGFNRAGDLIDFGVKMGVLVRNKAEYAFAVSGEVITTGGREQFRSLIEENTELEQQLSGAILQKIGAVR